MEDIDINTSIASNEKEKITTKSHNNFFFARISDERAHSLG